MKGNLSKKKGFLGEITESNLDYIASKLNTEYGKEINSLKNRTENSEEMIERHGEWIDDLALRTEETEKKVTTIDEKEDKSNKMMVTDDDGTYWSAAMTDMKIYQIIEEHIVQDLNEPREDRIPSVKAVSEAIKGIKPDIDLSDYYKKGEIDAKDKELQQDISDLQADIVGREEKSNKTNTIGDAPSIDKYPSEVAVFEKFMSFENGIKSYIFGYTTSKFYTKDQTKEEINTAIQTAIGDVLGGAS